MVKMGRYRRFVDEWGGVDALFVARSERLDGLDLDKKSAEFLREAGLPKKTGVYGLTFKQMVSPKVLGRGERPGVAHSLESYLVIGTSEIGKVCLCAATKGEVFIVDVSAGCSESLLNSDIVKLAEFLSVRKQIEDVVCEGRKLTPELGPELARQLRKEFLKLDPKALGKELFWKTYLEQLEQGF